MHRVSAPVSRRSRSSWLVGTFALAALAASCSEDPRPALEVHDVRAQVASALDLTEIEFSVSDLRDAESPNEKLVDVLLNESGSRLNGRFFIRESRWTLVAFRSVADDGTTGAWEDVGFAQGSIRVASAQQIDATLATIRELAGFVERAAADNQNLYPTVDMEGLANLVQRRKYARRWRHGRDSWGHRMVYHASPDGQAYIILSPGADGRWDKPLTTYFANTDRGYEAYDGVVDDARRDIIWATGALVQSYQPSP